MEQLKEEIYGIALSLIAKPESYNLLTKIKEGLKYSDIFYGLSETSKPEVLDIYESIYGKHVLAAAEKIFEKCLKLGVSIILYQDTNYPELLKEIAKPPLLLYSTQKLCNLPRISIVGTRNPDVTSTQSAYRLGKELSSADICIVSGMAVGIDRASHLGALNFKGQTIGVLANGIDIIYPQKNKDLFDMIKSQENSALISEYPPGIMAWKWTFVRRNRIISGLSYATIVVQAGEKSGSLITAKYALEQNRDIYVTGAYSFDSAHAGSINLINEGAKLLYTTCDVFESIPNYKTFETVSPQAEKPVIASATEEKVCLNKNELNKEENIVLNAIDVSGSNTDFLIRKTGLRPDVFAETVISLELYGYIERKGNYIYLKR